MAWGVPWGRGMLSVCPRPGPLPVSSLLPVPGIEREAMDREEPDSLRAVEDLLRAVAVMDVEIDDQDAVELEPRQRIRGRQGDVAEDAEAHAFAGTGMMPRGADQAEGAAVAALHHVRDGLDRRAGGQPCGHHRMRKDPGVGIQRRRRPEPREPRSPEVLRLVNPQQLVPGRLADAAGGAGAGIAGPLQMAEDRLEPLGTLGVPSRDAMLDHPPVRVQGDGHGSS